MRELDRPGWRRSAGRIRRGRARSESPIHKPAAVANRLGGDQDALGVPAVDDVAEALAFLADKVLGGNLDIVEEQRRSCGG